MKNWYLLTLALIISFPVFSQDGENSACETEDCWVTGFGSSERSLWLPSLPFGLNTNFEFDENGGHFETFADGRAHLYGQCIHMSDPNYGFYADIWFREKMNWEEWSALGRGWKGDDNIVGDLYETWHYYIMDDTEENTLTGTGNFEGSILYCTHRPADYHYGLQVGVAANDKNGEPGMSFWFNVDGIVDGEEFDGNADFNLEGECTDLPIIECLEEIVVECIDSDYSPESIGFPEVVCDELYSLTYSDEVIEEGCPTIIVRSWTASSIDGVAAQCEQTISLIDDEAPTLTSNLLESGICDLNDFFDEIVTDNCDPNPQVDIEVLDVGYTSGEGCDPGQLRTQTMGGWGTSPNGNNPGTYLEENFSSAFPDGLTIGCDNTFHFDSPQAIRNFLPAGGTPSLLPQGDASNPTAGSVLAGQLVAASLSVGFDSLDPDFGESSFALADLVIQSGEFQGWVLADLLTLANEIIGGCGDTYALSSLNDALSSVNENYVDGSTDNGFLGCDLIPECALAWEVIVTTSDDCGNQAVYNTTLYSEDTSAPEIIQFPEDVTVECGQIPEPSIEAIDECGIVELTVEVSEVEFSGACLPTIQRTYLVSDPCGNTVTHVQYITVIDTQSPVAQNTPSDLVINCGEEIPFFDPGFTDQCSEFEVELVEEVTPIECGFNTVQTWVATDNCGNTASVFRQVVQMDDEGPQPTTEIEDMIVSCGELLEIGNLNFQDACGEVVSVNISEEQIGEGCEYLLVRSYEATDNCGNTTIVSQTLTVVDDLAPVVQQPLEDITLSCGEGIPNESPVFTDDCSELSVVYAEEELNNAVGCSQTLCSWTAIDACGNSNVFERTITFVDQEPPALSGIPTDEQVDCADFPEPPIVTAVDNCDGQIPVYLEEQILQENCSITLIRTWTATDLCGNVSTAEQTLTFEDTQMPQITGDLTLEIDCNQLEDLGLIEATDDCGFALEVSFSDILIDSDASGCNRTFERTWFAIDACGNEASFLQTLVVTDNSGPEFSFVPADLELSCGDDIPEQQAEAFDACSMVSIQMEEFISGTECGDTITRTWSASDNCGNTSTATQIITFVDTESPVFTDIPAGITLNCGDEIPEPASVTAGDNCSDVVIELNESFIQLECEANYDIVRTWTATDACGNTAFIEQLIQVRDLEAPVFGELLEDITADCGMIPDPPVLMATDNCSLVTIDYEESFDAGGCPNVYRTWTATDACGNSASFVQTVFIQDNEPPVIEGIPGNMEATCNSIPPMPEPEVSDNCDAEVAVTANESVIGSGCEFTILRTWIASDDCGNTTVVSQSINVIDTESPVFVDAPAEVTVECSDLDGYPLPNVSDDCGSNVIVDFEDTVIEEGCDKLIERTYTATDPCGNSAQATMLIHVVDNTPPMISGVGPNQFVECDQIPEPGLVVAIDQCGGETTLTVNETTISQNDCGYILDRTYVAEDQCGNIAALTQLIYVSDNTAPVFFGVPENQVISCGEAFPEPSIVGALDNCDPDVNVTFAAFNETTECGETLTWIWTATDNCGNSANVIRTVQRTDVVAPEWTFVPGEVVVTCDAIPEVEMATATDNCSDQVAISVQEEIIQGGCPYEIRRTFFATDDCGNTAVAEQSIWVEDLEAPVFVSAPQGGNFECDALPEPTTPEAIDNCSGTQVFLEEVYGEPGCVQSLQRIWTAVDLCGNTVVLIEEFTIEDNVAPAFVGTPENTVVNCMQVQPMEMMYAFDACGEVEVEMSEITQLTECETEYTLTRMWTATDGCGNSSSAIQEIQVIDNIAPILMNIPEDVSVACDEIPEVPEVIALESCGELVDVIFDEQVILLEESDGCVAQDAQTFNKEIALWLPDVFGVGSDYVFTQEGSFNYNEAAGSATLTGEVVNTLNPEFRWIMNIQLGEARDWAAWSSLGRSYKDDLQIAEEFYEDWTYFILDGSVSTLVGAGELEGSVLQLTHAPSDSLFGFQLGMNANNLSQGEGLGGWFFYDGIVNGMPANGHGDVFIELACCPEQEIIRTWTAVDCAGNETSHTQIIHVGDSNPEPMMLAADAAEQSYLDVRNSEGEEFIIQLEPSFTGFGELRMHGVDGNEAEVILQQQVLEGAVYTFRVSKTGLAPGMYVFTFSGNYQRVSDQEVVLH